jgi:ABC-type Fe3+ transport system permease subunit
MSVYQEQRTQPPGAVGSLAWGILGLTMVPLIGAVLALVLSGKARRAIDREPGRYETGLATAGRILGWIGLVPVLFILVLVLVVVSVGVLQGT